MQTAITTPRPLSDRLLAGVISRGVVSVEPATPLPEVAAAMIAHEVHAVLVDGGPRAHAVDAAALVRALLEDERDAVAADVAQPLAILPTTATMQDALELMDAECLTHVAVAGPASGPAGVFSTFDVAAAIAGRDPHVVRLPVPAPARPLLSATALPGLRVADVMHQGVLACPPDAPLVHVAGMLVDHRIHAVVVSGIEPAPGGERLVWAVLSDTDLVAGARDGHLEAPAGTLAATEPLTVAQDEPLEVAVARMVEHDVTHLIAVNRAGLPAGVVGTLDVAQLLAARA